MEDVDVDMRSLREVHADNQQQQAEGIRAMRGRRAADAGLVQENQEWSAADRAVALAEVTVVAAGEGAEAEGGGEEAVVGVYRVMREAAT